MRIPSFTTRGIDEDEADEATDFGTDVDMGAEDAPERGEDSHSVSRWENDWLKNNCHWGNYIYYNI